MIQTNLLNVDTTLQRQIPVAYIPILIGILPILHVCSLRRQIFFNSHRHFWKEGNVFLSAIDRSGLCEEERCYSKPDSYIVPLRYLLSIATTCTDCNVQWQCNPLWPCLQFSSQYQLHAYTYASPSSNRIDRLLHVVVSWLSEIELFLKLSHSPFFLFPS